MVEPLRPGGAWCDVTGHGPDLGTGTYAAHSLRRRVRTALGLDAYVGVGPNKLLARMAARLAQSASDGYPRPSTAGVAALRRADVPVRLWPLPATDLPGVGSALASRFAGWNVRSIGDVAAKGPGWWRGRLGAAGQRLWAAAYGRDDGAIHPQPADDSPPVHSAVTMAPGPRSVAEARSALRGMSEDVARQLRERAIAATQITMALWAGDGRARSRIHALPGASDGGQEICTGALRIAAPLWNDRLGVRSLWLAVGGMQPAAEAVRQASLFNVATVAATATIPVATGRGACRAARPPGR